MSPWRFCGFASCSISKLLSHLRVTQVTSQNPELQTPKHPIPEHNSTAASACLVIADLLRICVRLSACSVAGSAVDRQNCYIWSYGSKSFTPDKPRIQKMNKIVNRIAHGAQNRMTCYDTIHSLIMSDQEIWLQTDTALTMQTDIFEAANWCPAASRTVTRPVCWAVLRCCSSCRKLALVDEVSRVARSMSWAPWWRG